MEKRFESKSGIRLSVDGTSRRGGPFGSRLGIAPRIPPPPGDLADAGVPEPIEARSKAHRSKQREPLDPRVGECVVQPGGRGQESASSGHDIVDEDHTRRVAGNLCKFHGQAVVMSLRSWSLSGRRRCRLAHRPNTANSWPLCAGETLAHQRLGEETRRAAGRGTARLAPRNGDQDIA
jgi:hypothetical protein